MVGEMTTLPLERASVDAAFANMVLHHAEDPEAMLREMARVVRPGGSIAITDEVEHCYAWMREEHADVWLGFGREQVERFFAAAGLSEGYGYEPLGMRSDASVLRPRVRSPTSASSPRGVRCRAVEVRA